MNSKEIETRLSQLGANWPVGSVAESVSRRLETLPISQMAKPHSRRWQWTLAGSVLILLVAISVVWTTMLATPSTLAAQVKASIRKSVSAHIAMTTIDAKGGRIRANIWYSREHGFRMESTDEWVVDDGRQQWTWNPIVNESDRIVYRRASREGVSMIAEMFQLENAPADWHQVRSTELDQDIRGKRCEAHLLEPSQQQSTSTAYGDSHPSPMRIVVWLDSQHRVVQVDHQHQADGKWAVRRETSIDYDIENASDKFAVHFAPATKIVDADKLWSNRFPLDKSLATAESGGLLFAIHEIARCEGDMFYVVSSVRGTSEHLKKFPPKRRRMNLQSSILEVAQQHDTAGSNQGCHRATLTNVNFEGVHYLWWIAVPQKSFWVKEGVRTFLESPSTLEYEPGRIRVPLMAHYLDPRAGSNWVDAQVELALLNDGRSETLAQIAGRARRDALLLDDGLNLYGSIKDNVVQILRPQSIGDDGFANELVSQIEWLRLTDEIPDPATSNGFGSSMMGGQTQPTSPESSETTASVRLPGTIEGQVFDQDGMPVSNANVTLRIQRFNPYVDPNDAAAPQPWTAFTDDRGRYAISTDEPILGRDDELKIKIRAEGFAEVSTVDFERRIAHGALPTQRLQAGRQILGRLVDPQGNPVAEATIRFHAATSDLKLLWDSGPLPVDKLGSFAVLIPKEGTAVIAIYPQGFAPQIVDLLENTGDLGPIQVEVGTSLRGRVVSQDGQGIAGTVVAIESEKHRFVAEIIRITNATAVRTDGNGRFTLPPFLGTCKVWVTDNAPDYSRQLVVTGAKPPSIPPQKIDFKGNEATKEIEFRAGK